LKFRKYNSIERYGKSDTTDAIIGKRIVVMEKIDGANASFTYDGDEIGFFSRNNKLTEKNRLRGFYDWGLKTLDVYSLNEDYIYYGEWLVSHYVKYAPEAYLDFYLFDIFDKKSESYVDFEIVKSEAERIGLKMPKVFFEGVVDNIEELNKYVGESDIALEYGEGIVVKNYNYPTKHASHVFVKIVSEKFKEVKGIKQNPLTSSTDSLDLFIASVLTEARVRKLIDKKIDLGLLPEELSISDTGTVLKTLGADVVNDIIEEELDVLLYTLKKKISKKTPLMVKSVIDEKNSVINLEVV
jgi:hypothetical protein